MPMKNSTSERITNLKMLKLIQTFLCNKLNVDCCEKILQNLEDSFVDICCVRSQCRKRLATNDLAKYLNEKNRKLLNPRVRSLYTTFPLCGSCYLVYKFFQTKKDSLKYTPYTNITHGFDNYLFWKKCSDCMPFIKTCYHNKWGYETATECCDTARHTIWKFHNHDNRPEHRYERRTYTDEELKETFQWFVNDR